MIAEACVWSQCTAMMFVARLKKMKKQQSEGEPPKVRTFESELAQYKYTYKYKHEYKYKNEKARDAAERPTVRTF